jgi:cyclopropane fatty-acyl-phospholipid synthase-like methyltransferase
VAAKSDYGGNMMLAGLRNWLGRGGHAPRQAAGPLAAAAYALAGAPAAAASGMAAPAAHIPVLWSESRIAMAEELWGEGYLSPGGASELARLAAPLGLSAASSLLLLGAEMGGPAHTLAGELGVWVAAHEADPQLAARAALHIQRAGKALAKRASVAAWNPQAPVFRQKFYHHAIALEAVRHQVPEPVLAAIAAALKPHGQLVLVETVAPAPLDRTDPAVAAWCRLEGRAPVLPGEEAITRMLGRLGFEVRVVEDMSARHMKLAVLGWKRLLRTLAAERPNPTRAAAVVVEAELWMRRIRLMHDGRIRLLRWHAILTAGG